jgi:hypothetical protein
MSVEQEKKKEPFKGYKRINFFKGFLTTEKDWNEAEAYHVEKRKLHNRLMHAPGVVLGYQGDLRVVARARGDLSVEVQPGYAIDGQGNDLVLGDATIKNINPEEYRLPQTIYVVLRFAEELTDFIAYKENLEYKGHRRVQEQARVELAQTEPDIVREVELARVFLEKGATRIRDPRDPQDPRANEIDMRFRPLAGVAGSTLSPMLKQRLWQVLQAIRKYAAEFARRNILGGHDVLQAANTAQMLTACEQVDMRNIFDVFGVICDTEAEMSIDVDVNHPNIAQKKEFTEFKRHVEILRGLLGERKKDMEALMNLFAFQTKATDAATGSIVDVKPMSEAPPQMTKKDKEEKKDIGVADIKDFEGVKVMANPPESIVLEGGITWLLIDQIQVLDKESEDKHGLAINDAKDTYRTRQKLKYPDGTVVEDTGRAHVGGYASYKILNVTPGRPLMVMRRMDYVYGDYELEFFVNNKSIGVGNCAGTDRINRWRNWPFLIPKEHVTDSQLTIKQVALTAGRDVNMFHYWFFQPK